MLTKDSSNDHHMPWDLCRIAPAFPEAVAFENHQAMHAVELMRLEVAVAEVVAQTQTQT
jgi:hypothetical protein